MSISSRITAMEEHISNAYTKLEWLGADLTNTDKNINNISSVLEDIWDEQPKVTATDVTEATLDNTKKARMAIDLGSNTKQDTAILPSDYTQLDYIESTGTQYIDTGYKPNGLTKVISELTTKTIPNTNAFFYGARDNVSVNGFACGIQPYWIHSYGNSNPFTVLDVSANTKYKIIQTNKLIINNNTKYNLTAQNFNCNYDMLIFAINNGASGSSFKSNYKLHNMQIYDNDVLVRDYIPAKRNSDEAIGLYDLVSNTFFTNAGTGTFTAGEVSTLPNPDYPIPVQVVSGDNEVKIQNKNLFDKNNVTNGYRLGSNGSSYPDGSYCISDYYRINKSTDYSCTAISSSEAVCYYDKDKNFLLRYMSNGRVLVPSPVNAYYSRIAILKTHLDTFQYEKGTTATTYEEHKETIYPINLGDIEMCKRGTYEDSFARISPGVWKKYARIGKKVFNGTNFVWQTTATGDDYSYFFSSTIDSQIKDVFEGLCDKFNVLKARMYSNTVVTTDTISIGDSQYGAIRLKILTSRLSSNTVAGFNQWLSSNNVTIYYILETPVYIDLPQSLQDQLEAIYNAMSYQVQTNITQENNDLPFILSASAVYDLANLLDN